MATQTKNPYQAPQVKIDCLLPENILTLSPLSLDDAVHEGYTIFDIFE